MTFNPEKVRIESALAVLRACRKSTLKDIAADSEGSTIRYVHEARASVYLFAISLLDKDSDEAKEWQASFEKAQSAVKEAVA